MTSRRLAVLACACLAPFGWLLFWAVFHEVPGQDWVVFHTAAARLYAHDLAMLADPRAFTDELNRSHAAWFVHPISVLHPFIYPPVTLLLAAAFGWLPYLWSLIAFLAVTLGLALRLQPRLDLGRPKHHAATEPVTLRAATVLPPVVERLQRRAEVLGRLSHGDQRFGRVRSAVGHGRVSP